SIMQERGGMGKTGETYLVGSDKLMRSDSFLDQQGHSVMASFAGNVQNNGVDTEASTEALAGKTDAKVIIDYNGNPVLSAFTPVDLGDVTWALLAEIDEAEVRAPINNLVMFILFIGLIIAAVVAAIAYFTARGIANPLTLMVGHANDFAQGDLSAEIEIEQKDEVGVLAESFRNMQGTINKVLTGTNTIISDIQSGKLDSRAETKGYEGAWDEMVTGLNNLIEAFVRPFKMTAQYVEKISIGDTPEKITEEYRGDFNDIKKNLNSLIDATDNVTGLTEKIAKGDLTVKATERSEKSTANPICESPTASSRVRQPGFPTGS
ncbi:hypothetical protein LCGC14_2732660, partial [marine sediment metagenome]